MSYVIAAYTIVLGSLVAYGVWVALQRRALARRGPRGSARPEPEGSDGGGA